MSNLLTIEGVSLSTSSSNSRYGKRDDSLLVVLEEGSIISGKFTKNKFKASPVKVAEEHLKSTSKERRILIVNAGIANAGTGKQGKKDALLCCKEVANIFGLETNSIIPFSTGIIGQFLDTKKQIKAFKDASKKLNPSSWRKAANSILTTDTKPKIISKILKLGKNEIKITGFAKGSGMIRPNFATLLSFVFLDAKISKSLLTEMHEDLLKKSFEVITVDGDTSPNDASLLIATGKSKINVLKNSIEEKKLRRILTQIYKDLASKIIQDAEGSTKRISINILKAKNKSQAKSVAFTVAESPLVKTALFGNDANWGRILAAIGRTKGIENISNVSISLNGVPLVKKGSVDPNFSEVKAAKAVRLKNIDIEIKLGQGNNYFSVLTSDLSEDYVLINSKYRS